MSIDEGFAFLADWYTAHCDGDWENEFGIELTSAEGGWHLRVDLQDTELAGRTAKIAPVDRSDTDYVHCHSDGKHFDAACGPHNLGAALEAFRSFAS